MRFLAELLYLLNIPGIGKATVNREFLPWRADREGEAFALAGEWLRSSGKAPDREREAAARSEAERILAWLEDNRDVRVCTAGDPAYPRRLHALGSQRPPVVYIRGRLAGLNGEGLENADQALLSGPLLAVIGARWPSGYTWRYGKEFAGMLVKQAAVPVISGLARGCDRIGHKAAIRAGLPTIAALPCGIDRIVPEVNRDLAERILNGSGLLLSEYAPGTEPEAFRYVERDRLTAALCSAAVVLDCKEKSGTMQTVKAASSFGRPVACWLPEEKTGVCQPGQLPGSPDREALYDEWYGFTGNRYLIGKKACDFIHDPESMQEFLNRMRKPAVEEQLSFL